MTQDSASSPTINATTSFPDQEQSSTIFFFLHLSTAPHHNCSRHHPLLLLPSSFSHDHHDHIPSMVATQRCQHRSHPIFPFDRQRRVSYLPCPASSSFPSSSPPSQHQLEQDRQPSSSLPLSPFACKTTTTPIDLDQDPHRATAIFPLSIEHYHHPTSSFPLPLRRHGERQPIISSSSFAPPCRSSRSIPCFPSPCHHHPNQSPSPPSPHPSPSSFPRREWSSFNWGRKTVELRIWEKMIGNGTIDLGIDLRKAARVEDMAEGDG